MIKVSGNYPLDGIKYFCPETWPFEFLCPRRRNLKMKKFEYKIIGIRYDEDIFDDFGNWRSLTTKVLDARGNDGWELVSVDNGVAYFKRERKEKGEE